MTVLSFKCCIASGHIWTNGCFGHLWTDFRRKSDVGRTLDNRFVKQTVPTSKSVHGLVWFGWSWWSWMILIHSSSNAVCLNGEITLAWVESSEQSVPTYVIKAKVIQIVTRCWEVWILRPVPPHRIHVSLGSAALIDGWHQTLDQQSIDTMLSQG